MEVKKKFSDKEWKLKGKSGEADRRIPVKMPKHLYSGKRGIGSNDYR